MMHLRTLADIAPGMTALDERAQFARIRLPGGIFKTTAPGRLVDVDQMTVAALGPSRHVTAIDIGASSGSTTVDLVRALQGADHHVDMLLSDISLKARLVQLTPAHAVLLTREGDLLQHVIRGIPVRPWRRRLDHLTQYWFLTDRANARFRRLRDEGRVDRPLHSEDIWMVVPAVGQERAIRCEEGDVFAAPPPSHGRAFDLVRAANLLIPGVFQDSQIEAALHGLVARLRGPGSLLALVRSPAPGQRGENRATIYRLADTGALEAVDRLGGGVDIEPLVPAGRT